MNRPERRKEDDVKKQLNYSRIAACAAAGLALSVFAQGSLTPPGSPSPTMHTLDEIYQKVENLAPQDVQTLSDTTTVVSAGYYAPTTLNAVDPDLAAENIKTNVTIFGIAGILPTPLPAPVPKTGQTTSYDTGDDGDLEKGAAWPNPRFTDNDDGTVTDQLTGLIWLKNANSISVTTWELALLACSSLQSGEAGLSDGSTEGTWRLPNIRELLSLIDYGQDSPALSAGHPFTSNLLATFWTSTTRAGVANNAWSVNMTNGAPSASTPKTNLLRVWPVRGGQ